ncbi:MAG: desulfoferrodoxin [Spirochaetes bacterium]|nr:desulfoferrodoxin [Spirochaetota bacterium]
MAQKLGIYKCEVCGNIVEVLHAGEGTLVCCGQDMNLLQEKSEDQGNEKHVPVVEGTDSGVKVKVGSVPHPMETDHSIQWIEVITKEKTYREFLSPGTPAEADFCVKQADIVQVRELCNLHGLWKA